VSNNGLGHAKHIYTAEGFSWLPEHLRQRTADNLNGPSLGPLPTTSEEFNAALSAFRADEAAKTQGNVPSQTTGGTTMTAPTGEAMTFEELKAGNDKVAEETQLNSRDKQSDAQVAVRASTEVNAFVESVRAHWPSRVAQPFAGVQERYTSRASRARTEVVNAEAAMVEASAATKEVANQAAAYEAARNAGYGTNG